MKIVGYELQNNNNRIRYYIKYEDAGYIKEELKKKKKKK